MFYDLVKVLIIEAGDLDQGEDQILIPFFALQAPDKYWWNITGLPLPGLGNRTQQVRSGKIVGGGTAVNAMMVTRGTRGDYDLWKELGNDGWGWNDLLPYFKKVTDLFQSSMLHALPFSSLLHAFYRVLFHFTQLTQYFLLWPMIRVKRLPHQRRILPKSSMLHGIYNIMGRRDLSRPVIPDSFTLAIVSIKLPLLPSLTIQYSI